ncbi:MAG: tetratricopeptide repeat protein [Desulfobacterales bacterium]|nr:tetratricopeptide repeat protein [Desulfobacterales bacterium]
MKVFKLLITLTFVTILMGCIPDPAWLAVPTSKAALERGDYDLAIQKLKSCIKTSDASGVSWCTLVLGQTYLEMEQFSDAILHLKKAVALELNNPATSTDTKSGLLYWLGVAYSRNQEYQKAINTFEQGIKFNPSDVRNFEWLSLAHYELGQHDEAITAAKRAIELKSDSAAAYTNLGAAYGRKKQYDEAMKALKKAIEINPKDANIYNWMGLFLMEQNAYNEAAEAYKNGIEAAPSKPDFRESLARAYYSMGRYEDAIETINKAIALQSFTGIGTGIAIESGYPVVKNVMETGPAKKAGIQIGDKIIKIDGKSTKNWTNGKVVQNIQGATGTQVVLTIKRKGVEKTINKTVTRETIIAKEAALSIGLRSLAFRHKGSLDVALKDAEKAYSLDSANSWAQLSLSASYLDRGKYDESIKLLAQVKDSPKARLYEATAYAKQGKAQEAVNIYLSIPEEEMSPKNIPLMNDRMALLQTFKPIVKEHRDKARSFESKGQYQEALAELSEALKIADDTELQDIQETLFSMIRRNPLLSEVPEDARKYALRSEVLVKEGSFEQAVTEIKKAIQIAPYATQLYYNSALWNAELKKYSEAIRNMKIYLKAVPDAPNSRAVKDEIIKWEFMMEKGK